MVVNTSHAEYMLNRDKSENHIEKLGLTEGSVPPIEGRSENGKGEDKKLVSIAELRKMRKPITAEDITGESKTGSNSVSNFFLRRKQPDSLTKRNAKQISIGLAKLKDLAGKNKTTGINNAEDLDYLLWAREPKELVTSVDFAQMLNFTGIRDNLQVKVTTILEDSANSANKMPFTYDLKYPLYHDEQHFVKLIPSATTKSAPHGNMIKIISQSTHAHGLTAAMSAKSVGVEVGLMTGKGATKMNAVRNQPVDMRSMALKAVLLKNQLAMAYGLDDNTRQFESRNITTHVRVLKTLNALDLYPANDVIIDITDLSDAQRELLLVLLSDWPSQRLVNNSHHDIYSLIRLGTEKFTLYVTQGKEFDLTVDGITSAPREYWSQCVQLFMNLGGLDDLVEVTRDTRGLAPIVTYNASQNKKNLVMVSPYPVSRCYHGLIVSTTPKLRYLAPTILESSTLVLLVDCMMLSAYLTNLLHLSEQMGLGSSTLYPVAPRHVNLKVNDALLCYNFRSVQHQSTAVSLSCPWLPNIDRFGASATMVLADITNRLRNNQDLDLVYCPITFRMTTPSPVSSHILITSSQSVDLGKIMGFESNLGVTGELTRLVQWHRAVAGNKLPKYGVSLKGLKLRGDEITEVVGLSRYSGNYSIKRVMAVTTYHPQKIAGNSIRHTFFHNPGYIQAQADISKPGHTQHIKPNSFTITGAGLPAGRLPTGATLQKQVHDVVERHLAGSGGDLLADVTQLIRDYNAGLGSKSSVGSSSSKTLSSGPEKTSSASTDPSSSPNRSTGSKVSGNTSQFESAISVIESSPPKVVPQGALQMFCLPKTERVHVPYQSGNCGVEALSTVIAEFDSSAGLEELGLKLDDRAWLQADELAMIAGFHGYDLCVLCSYPEGMNCVYRSKDSVRPIVTIYDDGGHFVPSKPIQGKTSEISALRVSVRSSRLSPEEKEASRTRIMMEQENRSKRGSTSWQ